MTPSPDRLRGRVVLVTGGSIGIGKAIVERVAAEGATVELCARTPEPGEYLVEELAKRGASVRFASCDVGDEAAVGAWVDGVAARNGRLDAAVLSAGVAPAGSIEAMALSEWEEMTRINLNGMFLTTRAAIPHLRASGGGSILTFGSIASYVSLPHATAYGATKGAALAFAKGLASELGPDRIRVNCLCPGATLTPLTQSWLDSTEDPEATKAELESNYPLGRISVPEDQAAAAAFLISDDASYITGTGFVVDGGYLSR